MPIASNLMPKALLEKDFMDRVVGKALKGGPLRFVAISVFILHNRGDRATKP
jgi:hypothetical protein